MLEIGVAFGNFNFIKNNRNKIMFVTALVLLFLIKFSH